MEIAEVVRRWQSGISQRGISTGTGLSRATVRRYIEAVVEAGLTRDGAAPNEEQLARLAGLSLAGPRKVEIPTEEVLAPWADQVYEWLTADRLQVTRIHELLADRGCRVSYTSLRRFIQRRGWQRRSPATVRMGESAPGEVVIGVNYFCRCASIILAGRPPVEDAVELPRSDSWGRRTPG